MRQNDKCTNGACEARMSTNCCGDCPDYDLDDCVPALLCAYFIEGNVDNCQFLVRGSCAC